MSTLREKLKPLTGIRRQFMLMRIAGLEPAICRDIVNIGQGTYNSWLANPNFVEIYRQLAELEHDHKQEAVQLLRRENQLEAVLLEGKILQRMKEELDTGEYVLLKTNIAREVYSKLITDLDSVPKIGSITWDQRVGILMENAPALQQGETYDAEFEEVSVEQTEHSESNLITSGQQANP